MKPPLQSPERRSDHRIVEWNIQRKAREWMYSSDQVILVVGNMPDPVGSKRRRYIDDNVSWKTQQNVIDGKVREWLHDRVDGEVTVALCSGSRGVDLEAYNTILNVRRERPNLRINVISILPVEKESFRKESVVGSTQESYWENLYNQLLADPYAAVHEPHFRPLWPKEYLGRGRKRKVTDQAAKERSILVNGNQNQGRIYSDTQQELMLLTERAYRLNPQIKKRLHMLLVTDGGKANGDGGTNEMVARFFKTFGKEIEENRSLRARLLALGDEESRETAKTLETICIIQDGMILDNGRRLVTPLEDGSQGQNEEYLGTVTEAYAEKFRMEGHDGWRDRRKTIRQRRRDRSHAMPVEKTPEQKAFHGKRLVSPDFSIESEIESDFERVGWERKTYPRYPKLEDRFRLTVAQVAGDPDLIKAHKAVTFVPETREERKTRPHYVDRLPVEGSRQARGQDIDRPFKQRPDTHLNPYLDILIRPGGPGVATGPGENWHEDVRAADIVQLYEINGEIYQVFGRRRDTHRLAIIGGIRHTIKDKLESAEDTLKRELPTEEGLQIVGSLGDPIYDGDVADQRMTATRSTKSTVFSVVKQAKSVRELKRILKAGDDVGAIVVKKVTRKLLEKGDRHGTLFGSHATLIQFAVIKYEDQTGNVVDVNGKIHRPNK